MSSKVHAYKHILTVYQPKSMFYGPSPLKIHKNRNKLFAKQKQKPTLPSFKSGEYGKLVEPSTVREEAPNSKECNYLGPRKH